MLSEMNSDGRKKRTMSAQIQVPSPKSLHKAVMHALGVLVVAAPPAAEVKLHNVGNGCSSCKTAGQASCVCQGAPFVWPQGYAVPPGWQVGQGGVLIMPNGQPVGPVSTPPASPPPLGMELPAGPAFNAGMWQQWAAQGFAQMRCIPYEDAVRDGLMMSMVQSDRVTIAAGATAPVDIQALNGWVDGYYFDIMLSTVAGAALPAESASITPPRNVGCPVPACTRDVPTSARFFRSDDGCCLGKPYRSILTETANGTPFRTAVTNHTAADMVVQTIVRGFCINTRICV
jgi:hypothetical protein